MNDRSEKTPKPDTTLKRRGACYWKLGSPGNYRLEYTPPENIRKLHSLKLTWHLKIGRAPKRNNRLPTIHFQVFSGAMLVSGRVKL